MAINRVFSDEFERSFTGTVILDTDIEAKLHVKHKVYKDDLTDALGDPYRVVMKPKQKSKMPINKIRSSGGLYELLCETSNGKVLFIIGRLFNDGNLYIITSYWANKDLEQIYRRESELIRDE